MFQFFNPIWLFSLAALAIPVIIHLWNVRPGKTLKVGSIAFLGETASKNARSFKLNALILLALRCLLLFVLALLLSEPFWRQPTSAQNVREWLLIQQDQVQDAYANFKPEIDSAIKAGYEFHYFELGFPKVDFDKVLADTSEIMHKNESVSYWSLLKALHQKLPENCKAFLISDNRLGKFAGDRPNISYHLDWQTFASTDSADTWIEQAYLTATDSLRVVLGESKPSGTVYRHETIKPSEKPGNFELNILDGKPVVKLAGIAKDTSAVLIDTTTTRIGIFTDKYPNDATYLAAAIGAIQKFTSRKITLSILSSQNALENIDFLFWLSDKPGPELAAKTAIFKYEQGKVKETNSWMVCGQTGGEKIGLFKRTDSSNGEGRLIWEDGFGNPLLTQDGQSYHFYTHFDPDWNNLVWDANFPQTLLPLLLKHSENSSYKNDKRIIDKGEITPLRVNKEVLTKESAAEKTDLKHAFWIILLIIFIVERWLSHKPKAIVRHG